MPTIITDGAASAQGYGFAARTAAANYIEDVFSTYLYTGSDSAQSISNGIDLATKGGMVWIKNRPNVTDHYIVDSSRISGGDYGMLNSNSTAAQSFQAGVSSFDSGGFSLDGNVTQANRGGYGSYASWTFRKQAKFFDVVTYTGNGGYQQIAHNLGSTPGCVIIKRTDAAGDWGVWHRVAGASGSDGALLLNSTAARYGAGVAFGVSSTTFSVYNSDFPMLNSINGATYVAYLFAHDAGGFGASGSDNVISCGSYTTDASADAVVNLGYEPQFLMIKSTSASANWVILDNIRGIAEGVGGGTANDAMLFPNATFAESVQAAIELTSTGFHVKSNSNIANGGTTYIYIAIRRGPMKTPTSGTSVFSPNNAIVGASPNTVTTNFPVDLTISTPQTAIESKNVWDRMRGASQTSSRWLQTNNTNSEQSAGYGPALDSNVGFVDNFWGPNYGYTSSVVYWNFRRAPGFFDVVCYTGNSTAGRTINHNLGVTPEMIIVKNRTSTFGWRVQQKDLGPTKVINLNLDGAASVDSGSWNNTSPTASVFTVGTGFNINASGENYVAYLFATVAGVSKVGSYTGTGTTKQIDCGFTAGARFVLIKRTDSTGDWYVWDSARGIVAGNDPYLLLNSTAAEVTGTDYVDTYAAGFEISSTAPAAINANGGSFIFLAIA